MSWILSAIGFVAVVLVFFGISEEEHNNTDAPGNGFFILMVGIFCAVVDVCLAGVQLLGQIWHIGLAWRIAAVFVVALIIGYALWLAMARKWRSA